MLCPAPKSTCSSPGTPRNERMVRRWMRSLTGVLFDQLADGVPAIRRVLGHELQEALGEAVRQAFHGGQDLGEELGLARTFGHDVLDESLRGKVRAYPWRRRAVTF